MEITNATPNATLILPAVTYSGAPAKIQRFTDDEAWAVEIQDEAVLVTTRLGTLTAPGGVEVVQMAETHAEYRVRKGYTWKVAA